MGIAFYAVARAVERNMDAICRAAWEEMEPLRFASFAVRAKRSDKSISARRAWRSEVIIGRYLLEKLRAAKSQRARAIERSGDDLLRGNHPEHRAGVRAENFRRGRPAGEHRGANDVSAFGRIRFGGGGVSHDEARSAFELRAFLWHGREARRIFAARGERAGAQAGAVSISREALPRAVRSDSARNRAVRAGRLSRAAVPPDDAANCGSCWRGAIAALALVTGDSLGQVASQTLRNLVAVDAACAHGRCSVR